MTLSALGSFPLNEDTCNHKDHVDLTFPKINVSLGEQKVDLLGLVVHPSCAYIETNNVSLIASIFTPLTTCG